MHNNNLIIKYISLSAGLLSPNEYFYLTFCDTLSALSLILLNITYLVLLK